MFLRVYRHSSDWISLAGIGVRFHVFTPFPIDRQQVIFPVGCCLSQHDCMDILPQISHGTNELRELVSSLRLGAPPGCRVATSPCLAI